RKMPWASKPVMSASIICLAAISASAGGTPQACNASRVNASIAAIGSFPSAMNLRRSRPRLDRHIPVEPIVDHAAHAGVAFREHEVIGLGEQMQVARLGRALEHL